MDSHAEPTVSEQNRVLRLAGMHQRQMAGWFLRINARGSGQTRPSSAHSRRTNLPKQRISTRALFVSGSRCPFLSIFLAPTSFSCEVIPNSDGPDARVFAAKAGGELIADSGEHAAPFIKPGRSELQWVRHKSTTEKRAGFAGGKVALGGGRASWPMDAGARMTGPASQSAQQHSSYQ